MAIDFQNEQVISLVQAARELPTASAHKWAVSALWRIAIRFVS